MKRACCCDPISPGTGMRLFLKTRQSRPARAAHRIPAIALTVMATISVMLAAGVSDESAVELRIKAAYVYNFARFVEWPTRSSQGPLRIGVLGHGDLAAPLEEIVRGKSANGRQLEVVQVSVESEADRCEIVLIERSESRRIKEIVEALAGKPVLTVCDTGNCAHDGGMIAFRMADESVRFQINQDAAEHAGLRISSQLLKVAIPAAGKPQ